MKALASLLVYIGLGGLTLMLPKIRDVDLH